MSDYRTITSCRCCDNDSLNEILNLGNQPLANSFLKEKDPNAPKFPLVLMQCPECEHLQLSVVVNPDLMFRNYLYVSGTTLTLKKYFDFFAYYTIERYKQRNNFKVAPKTILDIACNDGTQLNSYKELGLDTYGVDPATNLYPLSSKNHTILCDYLNDTAFEGKKFDIITAQNVFAHTDDVLGFLKNAKRLLADNGVLFIQTSQANMVENNEFDTIYHEHLSFFSESSMKAVAQRAGMSVDSTVKFDIHGVSQVFEITHKKVDDLEQYRRNVTGMKGALEKLVNEYAQKGYKVIGYGAAAKGMTLLGYVDLPIAYIIDDNPLKAGLFTPDGKIPVVPISALNEEEGNKLLIIPLAWNFFNEIKKRIKAVRDNDADVFVKYFPKVEIM